MLGGPFKIVCRLVATRTGQARMTLHVPNGFIHIRAPVQVAPERRGETLEETQADFLFIEAGDIQQAAAYAAFPVREYHLPVSRPA